MPNIGTRVRRGPDWKWQNQDGGGSGTVIGHSRRSKKKINIKEYFSLLKLSIRRDNRNEKCLYFFTFTVHSHLLLDILNHQDVLQNRTKSNQIESKP